MKVINLLRLSSMMTLRSRYSLREMLSVLNDAASLVSSSTASPISSLNTPMSNLRSIVLFMHSCNISSFWWTQCSKPRTFSPLFCLKYIALATVHRMRSSTHFVVKMYVCSAGDSWVKNGRCLTHCTRLKTSVSPREHCWFMNSSKLIPTMGLCPILPLSLVDTFSTADSVCWRTSISCAVWGLSCRTSMWRCGLSRLAEGLCGEFFVFESFSDLSVSLAAFRACLSARFLRLICAFCWAICWNFLRSLS